MRTTILLVFLLCAIVRISASPLSGSPPPAEPMATANSLLSAEPTLTAAPGSSADPSLPAPTLAARCGDGDCGGSTETTLQAATVTTTIVSITSVPCYVTTYITDSTTVTQTIYSVEIVTSTVTQQGTVWIIEYHPTPVLMSSTYYSTIEIIETLVTYWTTQTGSEYEVTSTGAMQSISGGQSESMESGWGGSSTIVVIPSASEASAWTHVSEAGDNVVATLATTAAVGWVTGGSGTSGTTESTGDGTVKWSTGTSVVHDMQLMVVVTVTAGLVVLWELSRVL